MEGRFPNGLFVAMGNCKDPEREEEYNRWYDEVHIPDATSQSPLRNGVRFVNAELEPGQPKYLALYETDAEDLVAARGAVSEMAGRLRDAGRSTDLSESVLTAMVKSIGSTSSATAGKAVRSLLFVSLDCKDPEREEELSHWHGEVHQPDVLESGFYHSAYRYENPNPSDKLGKFVAIYETDLDPQTASAGTRSMWPKWNAMGHGNDLGILRTRLILHRLTPQS
jgi:hypothetical protein